MSNEIIKTIYGKAKFCYLSSPDEAFGPGEYKVTLEVPKADASGHTKALQQLISKEVAEQHKLTPNQTTPLKRANLPYVEDVFTISGDRFNISQNIKKSFDPKRILNPDKMYAGI